MERIDHPDHYGGEDNLYEAVKVIDAWGADFYIGNVLKYLCRAGKKGSKNEDLKKAAWYLNEKIKKTDREIVSKWDTPHAPSSTFELY